MSSYVILSGPSIPQSFLDGLRKVLQTNSVEEPYTHHKESHGHLRSRVRKAQFKRDKARREVSVQIKPARYYQARISQRTSTAFLLVVLRLVQHYVPFHLERYPGDTFDRISRHQSHREGTHFCCFLRKYNFSK